MDKVKKTTLLMKIQSGPLKKYELRYVWYNPFDPVYLRVSKDPDYRGIQVISLKGASLVYSEDRKKESALQMVNNLQRRWKIKITTSNKKHYTFYFQSQSEFNYWQSLFMAIRDLKDPEEIVNDNQKNPYLQEEMWYDTKYGSSSSSPTESMNLSRISTPSLSPATSSTAQVKHGSKSKSRNGLTAPCIVIQVELPNNMGLVRLNLQELDDRLVSIGRFKERLFECVHAVYHQYDPKHTEMKTEIPSRYSRRRCKVCGGVGNLLMSRQMFQQETFLEEGPEFYTLQIVKAGSERFKPSSHKPLLITNPIFLSKEGGIFRNHNESTEDGKLLTQMNVYHPLKESLFPQTKELDDSSWIQDDDLALSSLVERLAPRRQSQAGVSGEDDNHQATFIQMVLRPSREIPISKFYVSITRYTREYDAISNFTSYVLHVRNGALKWEMRRRYTQMLDLDRALRDVDPTIPKLPLPATVRRHHLLGTKGGSDNDEVRFMQEMNEYFKILVDKKFDPPVVGLLSFVGVLSTGKEELSRSLVQRQRKIINIGNLSEIAEFGDLILFRSVNPLSGIQRRITFNAMFDHCGMVVKRKGEGYELLEATGEGVTSYPMEERIIAYSEGFCDVIALRKVRFERTKENLDALIRFTNKVEGKPYKLSLVELAKARIKKANMGNELPKEKYFCSELNAEALRLLGVLSSTMTRPDSYFLPHYFDEGGVAEKFLTQACSMDDIMFIDCKKPEIESSKVL